MRKNDLVKKVADIADISIKQADDSVSALFEHMTNALARGDSVSLVGFGSFTIKRRSSREGRNPKTGDEIHIPASKHVSYRAGKQLKDAVNKA